MSEVDKLKKENKKLKRLLKDAIELLNKYKDVIRSAQGLPMEDDEAKPEKKKDKKRATKKVTKKK
ncbi:MAG: hypothetical protein ABI579_05715 [Candidatus Sumerlaeota bacterium]